MADNLDNVADVADVADVAYDQTIITFDFEGTQVTYDTIFGEFLYQDNEDASLYEPDI